jgi:serine protease Do
LGAAVVSVASEGGAKDHNCHNILEAPAAIGYLPPSSTGGKSIMKKLCLLMLTISVGLLVTTRANAQQLRDVVRQVDPSVVVIKTVEKNVLPVPQTMFVSSPGLGSGVLIPDGKILTAAHVVQAADKIEVEFIDGQVAPAKVIASLPRADVAMLKLDWVPHNAVPARLGNSDKMQVGDDVFIIGAPYGIGHSVSVGHVSARRAANVSFGAVKLELLQTDAAINKGNSGGPMFNMAGEVVGVISYILSQSGGFEGLGFAVTVNVAQKLLVNVKGFWSGIDGAILSEEWVRIFNIPQPAGFLVQRIADNSPASKIGLIGGSYRANIAGGDLLVGGDIILSVGAIPVVPDGGTTLMMIEYLNSLKPGDKITMKVLRAGQITELEGYAPAR